MARAIEQIERELVALSKVVSGLAAEFRKAYTSYLEILGQATRSHLMQATYQICTHGYPKQFLSLSFSQRQQLQQAIRKLGQNAADQLLAQLEETDSRQQTDSGTEEAQENSQLPITSYQSAFSFSQPLELLRWKQKQEEEIGQTLKILSLETNRLLQQAGILPQKLSTPLLEAATTASEIAAEMTSGPPNLLNLLVETENQSESEDTIVTQLIAVQLRLSEIEFADTTVRAARNQIRQLEAHLSSLGQEYQQKQRERLVAEAESAWRASWFDD